MDPTAVEPTLAARRERTPSPSARMGTLAREYPELASFTADATLLEIKTMYGLASLEEVRRLGRLRAQTGRKPADRHTPACESVATRQDATKQATPGTGR